MANYGCFVVSSQTSTNARKERTRATPMPRALTDLARTRASATKVTRAPAKIVRVSIKLNQPTKCIISLPRKLLFNHWAKGVRCVLLVNSHPLH